MKTSQRFSYSNFSGQLILLKDKLLSKVPDSIIPVIAIVLAAHIGSFIVTQGSRDFKMNELYGGGYISQLDNLKRWSFEIDRQAIGGEYFSKDGKDYMYFGFFPSLLRWFIELFFERHENDWSRVSGILAFLTIFWSVYRIVFERLRSEKQTVKSSQVITIIYATGICFGSLILTLLSSLSIYHEAILWGLAWNTVFTHCFFQILGEQKQSTLILAALSAGFAFHSRVTFGVGPLVCLIAVLCSMLLSSVVADSHFLFRFPLIGGLARELPWVKHRIAFRRTLGMVVIPAVILFTLISFYFYANYKKWGNPFVACPVEYHNAYLDPTNAHFLKRIQTEGTFSFRRFPLELEAYLMPHLDSFSLKFPFIVPSKTLHCSLENVPIFLGLDAYTHPIPISSFFLAITGLLGIIWILLTPIPRKLILCIVFAYLPQVIFILGYFGNIFRYEAEFAPLLIVFSSLSVVGFNNALKKSQWTMALMPVLLFICLLSIFSASATTVAYDFTFDAGRRQYFSQLIPTVNLGLFNTVLQRTKTKLLGEVPVSLRGVLWQTENDQMLLWNDGRNWDLLQNSGKKYGAWHLSLKWGQNHKSNTCEPLVSVGKESRSTFLLVDYQSKSKIQLRYEMYGGATISSGYFQIDPDRIYEVDVQMGSFYPIGDIKNISSNLEVRIDGKNVLKFDMPFWPANPESIKFGENSIKLGTSCKAKKFTGTILKKWRLASTSEKVFE